MTENEMNNQAAQTMPELPEPAAILEHTRRYTWFVGSEKLDHKIEQHNVYTADQMHQYARDYAAMLAAAPAASGGDRPEPDARCNCGWGDIKDHLREECTPKDEATTTPPSAAPVSERARDDLHVAICQAVALMNMEPMTTPGLLQAHDILRKAIS